MNAVLEWVMGSPHSPAGAIDVIAIRNPDGTLACSPFHVQLGKPAKKGEKKVVKLRVNGKSVDLSMKLGPAGEAFFVERSREYIRKELYGRVTLPEGNIHLGSTKFSEPKFSR
jgi:phosphatidate phosphatase PAH1